MDGFEPPHLLGDLSAKIRGVGQFALRAGTDDIIHVLSARERAVRNVLEQRLRPGDVFVDAGANIGFFSVIASNLVGESGQVIAFEMMPETAARLRHHFAINDLPSAKIFERALFDKDGETITATSSAQKFGQASVSPEFQAEPGRTIRHDVPTVRLDTALADIGDIALMKMDLEGAELGALLGAKDVLARCAAVIFENNSKDERVVGLLRSAGFSIRHLGGREHLAYRSEE
ncbi:FkbM family methyltransferase [Pontixanthobacter aquaemixtae]|uniref:FkbM family methyltransferase n=1 Tax=Pontixanthobacter aquaemixtae TaxID=1958940 RepID=A0A844ZV55_9SPHN|nr:FkbM family methyltransferase [Pontixanthobacter aquaemixtae]MXO91354.1 FkbM family methyltransferase [Pontixanthobacter aquaemixtae]